MSTGNSPYLSFHCPQCQKRLKAPESLAGKRVACPKCSASVVVPSTDKDKEAVSEDDWFALDAPSQPTPTKPSPPVSDPMDSRVRGKDGSKDTRQSGAGSSLFDDDLPELAPLDPEPKDNTDSLSYQAVPPSLPPPINDLDDFAPEPLFPGSEPKSATRLKGSLEELSLEEAALSEHFQAPTDDEFAFPCKVCGSLLYAKESRIGTITRCPDCFSEFSIPSPPTKKKQPSITKVDDQIADVKFAPIDAKSVHADRPEKDKTKEMLDRASIEVERDKEEEKGFAGNFDSQRWIELIFGFVRDPGIVIASIALGIFNAVWFYVLYVIGSIQDIGVIQAWIVRILISAVLIVPITGSILMCALAIIPMAANRKKRVEEWPIGKIGESIGEAFMFIVSIAISSVPGGMLATLVSSTGGHIGVSVFLVAISITTFTPFLILCMIENNSVTEPFSKAVFKSISLKPDAWGAMFMQSGIAMFLLACLLLLATSSATWSAVLGLVFPFLCFFIANQYGVLAGRISAITDMGFEGDFSDDD